VTDTYDKENYWYGHNGGERPVHPETLVTILFSDGSKQGAQRAGDVFGWTSGNIAAFLILKLYREPRKAREWWVNVFSWTDGAATLYACELEAKTSVVGVIETIHVREVLPEDEA